MPAFILIHCFNLAVWTIMRDHERCDTYVKPGFSKSTGRRVNRPKKHVKVRLEIISTYFIYTEMNKQYKKEIYLNFGSNLR